MGMNDYPHLAYSMNAVRKAGIVLAGDIVVGAETSPPETEILQTFAIAHSWRNSHVYPMTSVRSSLIHRMRAAGIVGITASRPKRMSSIRKKLRRFDVKLDQINDLAGCRAILDDSDGVRRLIEACRSNFPHEIRQEYPYIEQPKADGYRSHHMVFNFSGGNGVAEFAGRRVELQVRTRLQHSWATAVEAVGLYRNEDMKAGFGDPGWLRLFALLSAEFAHAERSPAHNEIPSREYRVREIRDLNRKIGASKVLEDIKNVTHFAENYVHAIKPKYYLLRYMPDHTVSVESFSSAVVGAESLDELERQIEAGQDGSKVVLVEVDKVDRLVEAYPNYFGDVSLLIRNLKHICDGQQAIEYSMAPQQVVKPKPHEKPDVSLLYRRYTRWTERRGGGR